MALSRKKKIVIGVIAAVVLLSVVVISVIATRKDEPEVITVTIDVRPELKQTVTASGEVRPIRYIKLTSEVAGRIEEIYVSPGDMVTKGKPLVRLDPTQLQSDQEAQWAATQASINDVQNARNAVTSAQQSLVVAESSVAAARQQVVSFQTAVDKAQVDLSTAQRELKRYTELIEAGVASRFEYDTARDRFETAKIASGNCQGEPRGSEDRRERSNGACQPAAYRRERSTNQHQIVRDARQPTVGYVARSTEPTFQGNAVVAADRRHRRHSYARR